jgi:hypothetical protein
LQRRMRDLHVAAQHVGVQQRHYVNSGKLLLDSPAAKSNIVGTPRQNLAPRGRTLPLFSMPHDTDGSAKNEQCHTTKHRPKISRRDRCDEWACQGSKGFCMWTHIELLRPSRTMLRM